MTNKLTQRSIEEFLSDYTPGYIPLLPLLLAGQTAQYSEEVGNVKFDRAEAVGDLRAKMFGPKDTIIHQVGATESSKNFKKYFFGAQFVQSTLQDTRGYESVVAQVLDENNKFADELLMVSELDASGNLINNGLYLSNDPNYTLKPSVEIAKDGNGSYLASLYGQIAADLTDADVLAGEKLVLFYGTKAIAALNALFPVSSAPFMRVIEDGLEADFQRIPSEVTPSGGATDGGYIIVNRSQVKLHYVGLPKVDDQGINAEKKYAWTNFLVSSMMVDVLNKNGIIRRPLTWAA